MQITIRIEETEDSLFLLKWLYEAIKENAIKTSALKTNVILVVLVEGVHGISLPVFPHRRINPDTYTSILHAGLSSTRHLEPCDGLRLSVCEFAATLPMEEKYNVPFQVRRAFIVGAAEYRRGLRFSK